MSEDFKNYYGYIYKTTNLINGKYYIGMHRARKPGQQDLFYLGSGTALKLAIKKYGKENFKQEIISWHKTRKELEKVEISIIKECREKANDNIYNISDGGDGVDPKIASINMKARWNKMDKAERSKFVEPAHKRKSEMIRNGELKPKRCEECEGSVNSHKKICSKYNRNLIPCEECGALSNHFKFCSQFIEIKRSDETKKKLSIIAQNRPLEYNEQISKTLKENWKDPAFAEKFTCDECGGRSNNHRTGCSKVKVCKECNSSGYSHRRICSKYKEPNLEIFICPDCSKEIKSKWNLKQHKNSNTCKKNQLLK